jgi:hypothetical protein
LGNGGLVRPGGLIPPRFFIAASALTPAEKRFNSSVLIFCPLLIDVY